MFKKYLGTIWSQLGKKFVELMALLVAAIAVMISVKQGDVQKEVERVNKQPLLQIEYSKANYQKVKGFEVKNVGYGPAIIKSFKVFKNKIEKEKGKIASKDWEPLLDIKTLQFKFEYVNYLAEGYVMGEKEGDNQIHLLGTSATELWSGEKAFQYSGSKIDSTLSNVIIDIEYKSINPLDEYTYFLSFCDSKKPSNSRDIK